MVIGGIKNWLTTGGALLACAATANAQTLPDYSGTYLCKLTASAGLKLNQRSKSWTGVIFNVSDATILMKIENSGQVGSSTIH